MQVYIVSMLEHLHRYEDVTCMYACTRLISVDTNPTSKALVFGIEPRASLVESKHSTLEAIAPAPSSLLLLLLF